MELEVIVLVLEIALCAASTNISTWSVIACAVQLLTAPSADDGYSTHIAKHTSKPKPNSVAIGSVEPWTSYAGVSPAASWVAKMPTEDPSQLRQVEGKVCVGVKLRSTYARCLVNESSKTGDGPLYRPVEAWMGEMQQPACHVGKQGRSACTRIFWPCARGAGLHTYPRHDTVSLTDSAPILLLHIACPAECSTGTCTFIQPCCNHCI